MKNNKLKKNLFLVLAMFFAFIFVFNVVEASFLETKEADKITKNSARLKGQYLKTQFGQIPREEFVGWVYSKTAPANNSCRTLYYSQDKKSTKLIIASRTSSFYDSYIYSLESKTRYYFCFIVFEEINPGFGFSKKYDPVEFGNVLSFETVKGFENKAPGTTPIATLAPRGVTPDSIGEVSTYFASRTTDTEALFSGYVSRVDNEAHAYFRYAILEKPPVFCNDIYGSAQRSIVATRPNSYGILSKGAVGFSAVVRGLTPNTTYYYCAVVSNNAVNPTEIKYGPVLSFRTLPCQTCPQTYIKTNRVVNISSNTATFYGEYGSVPPLDVYFEYKKENELDWKKTAILKPPQKKYGDFWQPVSGLSKSTVYQFRAVGEATTFSKTGGGAPTSKIFYGEPIVFKTTSGNLFDKFGWTEEPDITNPENGDGTIDSDSPDDEVDCEPFCGDSDTDDGSCHDGVKNGDETGIDKGGRCGPDPENPLGCEPNCDIVIPPLPTCDDGIQNGNETGVDTGGWCGDGGDGDCFDNIQNGDETGIDTGGRCFFGGGNNGSGGYNGGGSGGGGSSGGGGGGVINVGPGTVLNNGGTVFSSGGTTTINGGVVTTNGGTTTVSGGTTSINGGNTNINNGVSTNTGGVATTTGGTTTLRGGTTTVTYKGPNGEEKKCISNGIVTVAHANGQSVVNCNNEIIIIKDGEGNIVNVGGSRTSQNGSNVLRGGNTTILNNNRGLRIGDRATPPNDAIVRYHEGIETVFTRQIMRNLAFARLYGYENGMDLQNFADTLSHTFAKEYFGYINEDGLEVRVAKPDVSAYELRQVGGVLTVYEYYENIIIDIRNTTTVFKNKNPYEYYDRRRR